MNIITWMSCSISLISMSVLNVHDLLDGDQSVWHSQNLSTAPRVNSAKSYFTGSSGSKLRRQAVSSRAACQSEFGRLSILNLLATLATCRSIGQISCDGLMFFHMPKSTPLSSFLTIHLRNIFSRLHPDFFPGLAICFRVRPGT